MKKKKLFLTISLVWIILIGYLVWANGLMNEGSKKFKWDEWNPEEFKNLIKNDKH